MPIFLGDLLNLAGIKANIDIPIKAKYMIKDCKLWAEKYNITFKFNNYFPIKTLNLLRCALVAEKKDFAQIFITKISKKNDHENNPNIFPSKLLFSVIIL